MWKYDFADNQKYVFFTIPKNLKEPFLREHISMTARK